MVLVTNDVINRDLFRISQAPAAFGLVSYLMHSGLEKKHIQGHLLAFSAAAPIVAITTYFVLHAVRNHISAVSRLSKTRRLTQMCLWLQSGNSSQSQLSATGIGMLFSAGTFLYVATVHILPEVSSSRAGHSSQGQHQQHLGLLESITLILGVGLPMLLALGLHDN